MPRDEERTEGQQGGAPAGQHAANAPTAPGGRGEAQPSSLLPAVSLPKGGGAIRGIGEKFSTNPATGTGSLSIPIATSAGRAGFEPGLELGYDSSAGNGPFGIGWHLSTPSVTRKTDKGLPRYADAEDSDVFVLSGAEDLVPIRVKDGTGTRLDVFDRGDYRVQRYRPRTEGLFARIERWTNRATGDVHWRAITRENVLNVYGKSPAARIADPEHPERVFSWLLEETRDDRGNVARYTYKAEDDAGVDSGKASESNRFESRADGSRGFLVAAQRYLKRIQYGNRAPVMDREAPVSANAGDWLFEVVFDYGEHDSALPTPAEDRPWPVREDPFSSYRAAFEVRTYRLCRRILVFHRFAELGPTPCLVRSTDFTYDEGPVVTYLVAATQAGYTRAPGASAYERATQPSLELGYVKPELHDELRTIDRASLEGIPGGIDGATALWVDLDGEGLPGVLIPTEHAWFYKPNLGGSRLAPPKSERWLPVPAELQGGVQQLMDLGGDGNLDLVRYSPPLQGYFERTSERAWAPFNTLRALPNIDWHSPNLRFLDIDGDGLPDILITENDAFVWYRSRAKEGFEPAAVVTKPRNELKGPDIVFAADSETIHLADMSGDGLVDIVRVRNGEVCYWPNLGYGRFGRKVTLDQGPLFDTPEQFDPKRIRFADIDGSGTNDIIYLGRDGVRLYFNESGNRLSKARLIKSLPPTDSTSSLSVVDLLGQGTSCLVWSSPLQGNQARPLLYIDLMGGKKPHMLEKVVNNLGAETRIAYAPSTKFYLKDKAEGKPWLTRLAFPVQVIERVESHDHVAGSKLVTTFAYHHGYFDGHEREFRGFARVEQWDAESFRGEKGKGLFPELPQDIDPGDEALNLPPVRTVMWFHTGAWLERERLELALAKEYYDKDPRAPLLPDTLLPEGLSVREEREAVRALRGRPLRKEVYAEDGTPLAGHPYAVSEQNHEVKLIQRAHGETHAVFFVHSRHSLDISYERSPADPRMQHEVVLQVDDFGNVTRAAAVGYPRRVPQEPEQARCWVSITERTFINRPDGADWYRVGVSAESVTSELTGVMPAGRVFTVGELASHLATAVGVPFESTPGPGVHRRVVARDRRLYYKDDLSGPLPLGQIQSRALTWNAYRQVFTPGLLAEAFGTRVTDALLEAEGRYVQQDGAWWAPTGRAVFDPARFFVPIEAIDPFGHRQVVRYDSYTLAVIETEDALGNRVTAGLRNAAGEITSIGIDYRIVAPVMLTDPNLNRTMIEVDALGMVVKTAVMGKEGAEEGDTLADPTTKIEYDLHRWRLHGRPVVLHASAREQHGATNSGWQETYSYSDGFGRTLMKKSRAEAGPVPVLDVAGHLVRNADGSPLMRHEERRWMGTGRTVFDNKGNVLKKYEPFFSGTFEYEDEKDLVEWGVTPVLRYDPLGRLVSTHLPNGTVSRVVFNAWTRENWDENDTVAGTPWLARKQAGSAAEQRCAALALAHAGTPTVSQLDALGRVFQTLEDNGPTGDRRTRVELDLMGNQRSITDARGNMILRQIHDMTGGVVRVVRADAGTWDVATGRRAVPVATDPEGARTLRDVAGKPIRLWDERGHVIRRRYDALQRPTHVFLQKGTAPEKLVERNVYGEAHAEAVTRNLRARTYQGYQGAGVLTNTRFDFKGNVVESALRLAVEYRDATDWSAISTLTDAAAIEAAAAPLLEAETFSSTVIHDALNRVRSRTTPDGSETRPTYNEANLLEMVDVRLRGAADWTPFIESVDYNARGQRNAIVYANGTTTTYTYDEETFRLVSQRTVRESDGASLQHLSYEYDPVGNIVEVRDEVSWGNPAVSADGRYEYDALYQLVVAEGREHPGQQPAGNDPPLLELGHPNDMQALRRYRETYSYDLAGNIERMVHAPLTAGASGWTRSHAYARDGNRLLRTSAPGDAPGALSASYSHDEDGNLTRMPHLPLMQWDHADHLQFVSKQAGAPAGEGVYFTYDSTGERVRKVYEHNGLVEERIYSGSWEVYRKRVVGSPTPVLVRETLHVSDGSRLVALVETKTADTDVPALAVVSRSRFQLANHLGSSALECDPAGAVISYEEYYPFGATSFHAGDSAAEVSRKRYRYTGKERDEETGLDYHGARYYAPWLGRWTSCDPAGMADGQCWYAYVRNNPLRWVDPSGHQGDGAQEMMRGMLWDQLGWELSGMWEGLFGGSAYVNPRANKMEWTPSQGGVGGVTGGIIRTATLHLVPIEQNPSAASLAGMETGAGLVPIAGPALELITGQTVTGLPASRLQAAAFLALDLLPFALEFAASRAAVRAERAAIQAERASLAEGRTAGAMERAAGHLEQLTEAQRSAWRQRAEFIRDALTNAAGKPLTAEERAGVTFAIRRMEAQGGWELVGSLKYSGNQGIDLVFRGTGANAGQFAVTEAKAGRFSLKVDELGIQQASRDFIATRLSRAQRAGITQVGNVPIADLQTALAQGRIRSFGAFAGNAKLYEFDLRHFLSRTDFRTAAGAAMRREIPP
jgi:RHS repeat-associated protein